MDYNMDDLLKYSNEDIDRVIDLIEKMEEYAKTKGINVLKLLQDLGHFTKMPTVEELRENKNNIAQTLDNDLQNIVRNTRGH